MKQILFVGISNKLGKEPFDSSTSSGQIIDQMIEKLPNYDCKKMNYVSYAPLDESGKLRKPNAQELSWAFSDFQNAIQKRIPDLFIVCGKMVEQEFKKHSFYLEQTIFISHPSYIYVYHRKDIDSYVKEVIWKIENYFRKDFGHESQQ